jgi:hypothetical protein
VTAQPVDLWNAVSPDGLSPENKGYLCELLDSLPAPVPPAFMPPKPAKKLPSVLSFRRIVNEALAHRGRSLDDVVVRLFDDLERASRFGDVQATKLLLERLCGKDPEQVEIAMQVSTMTDDERVARIQAYVAEATRRRILAEGPGILPPPAGGGTMPGP